MKSIMMTYPGFQRLPREIKKLLLVSESYFFGEITRPKPTSRGSLPSSQANTGVSALYQRLTGARDAWRN
ncbi:MAG: hypothetical protein U1F98_14375 [Verrucomicrobiota bacterium]